MEKGVVKLVVFNGEDFGYWKNRTRNYLLSQGRAIWEIVQETYVIPDTLDLALVAGVVPVVVVVLVGGVGLLPLGAVGDEVSGVTSLEAAPRRPPPLLAGPVQHTELPRQQGDLVIGDALVLLIRSCTQGRQGKL
jgi:hypothetical protein